MSYRQSKENKNDIVLQNKFCFNILTLFFLFILKLINSSSVLNTHKETLPFNK